MIRAVLKAVDAVDLPEPPESWAPDEDHEVNYELTLHIGEPGSQGAELYWVTVLDHQGLKSLPHKGGLAGQPPPIVVSPYSWEAVEAEVARRLAACEGINWTQVQEALRGQFAWEYEGMAPRTE